MSVKGQQDRAYPRSEHQVVGAWILGTSCSWGKGGGNPGFPIGYSMTVLEFRVPKFDVYNRKLVLFNKQFDVYADGGPDPMYGGGARVPGARQDWWLGFGVDASLTGDQVKTQEIKITTAYPCEIEVDAVHLPQPTDPGWDNKIYIYLYWEDPGLIITSHQLPVNLDVIKHDYDIKI